MRAIGQGFAVWRLVAWIACLILIAGGGWGIYVRVDQAKQPPPRGPRGSSVAVEVRAIEQGTIRNVRHFTGTLQARAQYEVAPRVAGRLESLTVDIGDIVERGQVIALLDDDEFVQQVEEARAELDVALATLEDRQSSLEIAQREFSRIERLRGQQIASEAELDSAESRLKAEQAGVRVADAQVAQRRAALRAAQVRMSYTRILATWQGSGQYRVVAQRFVDEGTTLSANTPILSLLDIDHVLAVINVAERDYRDLSIGQRATIRVTGHQIQQQEHIGTVTRMAPLFFEGSRQARVEIDIPNEMHLLKPGMFVRVSLELGRDEQATILPRQALVSRDGRQGVFLVDEQDLIARFIPVQVGIAEQQRVQLLDPLIDGQVVVLGQHLLADQTPVIIAQANPSSVAQGENEAPAPASPPVPAAVPDSPDDASAPATDDGREAS